MDFLVLARLLYRRRLRLNHLKGGVWQTETADYAYTKVF